MTDAATVKADPFMGGLGAGRTCFACNIADSKKSSLSVSLQPAKIARYAAVDTGEHCNPFKALSAVTSPRWIFALPVEVRKLVKISCKMLEGTARMLRKDLLGHGLRLEHHKIKISQDVTCSVCASLGRYRNANINQTYNISTPYRKPCRDYTICNVIKSSQYVQKAFSTEFCRLSGCQPVYMAELLKEPASKLLCYIHVNHSRYARNAANLLNFKLFGNVEDRCVFTETGCGKRKGGLRLLPVLESCNLQ